MFEKHRDKKVVEEYQSRLVAWQAQVDSSAALLDMAESFVGETTTQTVLRAGEALFATVTGASLVEERRGAGQYTGHSNGVSIPIGSIGGHAVRYHVGATKGHYVQAPPVPTAIDTGTVVVTNQRVIFQGARQTRECMFSKLIGFEHHPDGSTVFSVSNRQKPTVIHYGARTAGWFAFRLDLALAHYRGTVAELVAKLTAEQRRLEAARPVAPVPTA